MAKLVQKAYNNGNWSTLTGYFLLAIVSFGLIAQIEGQFFTKSSKSIPRMGRRSNGPPMDRVEMRRQLIDTILGELAATNPNAMNVS